MRILILGGTRFIGRALTERLLADGNEVHLVTRTVEHAAFARPSGAYITPGDRRDPETLKRATGRGHPNAPRYVYDAVYDFLGFDAHDARVAVEALRDHCKRLVFLSTGSVYWVAEARNCPWVETDGQLPLRDRATCDHAEFDYGVAKRACEEVYRASGMPVVIVRAPVVSGPNDHKRRDQYWVRRIAEGRPCILPDGGTNVFNHVYVDDLVEMLARLANAPDVAGEAFNACDRVFTTLREYVERLAAIVGREPVLVDVPRAAIAAARLDDRSFYFADTKSHALDNRKAESRLGMRFRTPDEWMPPTVAWCLRQPADPAEDERLAIESALARSS